MDRTRLLFVLFGGLSELCCHVSANRGGSPSFTDEIPFKINWPGDEFTLPTSGALYKDDDFVIMTTTEKEKYKCLLPSFSNGDDDDVKAYAGPTPSDLLDPLFKQSSCSYRVRTAQFHFYFCLNIGYLEYHCNTSNTNVMGLTPLGSVARYTGTMVISRYQKVMILMIPTF
nr:endoplasmic reticulum lectin 1-like [Oncorhynchus nerka]